MYLLVSLGFVVLGLVEFALVIVMNRSSSGTKEKMKNAKNQKMKRGNPYQRTRTLNQILAIRCAMNKHENETKPVNEGSSFIGSLHGVDIIACFVFLLAYICFNFVYFYHFRSTSVFSCDPR